MALNSRPGTSEVRVFVMLLIYSADCRKLEITLWVIHQCHNVHAIFRENWLIASEVERGNTHSVVIFLRNQNMPRKERRKHRHAVLFVKYVSRMQSLPWYFWKHCRERVRACYACSGAAGDWLWVPVGLGCRYRLSPHGAQSAVRISEYSHYILHCVRKLKSSERGTHRSYPHLC